MAKKNRILLIDDEHWIREFLKELFIAEGYDVETAGDEDGALQKLRCGTFDIVITDLRLGGSSGIDILKIAKAQEYLPEVLLITAYGSVETAVDALKLGAFDFLTKPLESSKILETLEQALERRKLRANINKSSKETDTNGNGSVRDDYLLYYDPLTKLPNRDLFFDRLGQAILKNEPSGRHLAIFIFDIDGFKLLNDVYGPAKGDEILIDVSRRIESSVFARDTIARVGSDEFGVVADIKREKDIVAVLERIRATLNKPITIGAREIAISTTAGIAVYPRDGTSAEMLVQNAGLSLAQAKRFDRSGFRFFTADMNERANKFFELRHKLTTAVENGELELFYQPYYEISTNRMVGLEALLRWRDDQGGYMLPGEFIPILEETKMIQPIGEWICETVCRQIMDWEKRSIPAVPVAINISPVQFMQQDLTERITSIVKRLGVDPRQLVLEVTETTLMQDIDVTERSLRQFKDTGMMISVDDFGTGYSSLSYLKFFPIDNLKIDMSFVKGLSYDSNDASIIAAIISMAHNLNLRTISEGVENTEQLRILESLKCAFTQGFLHCRPKPADQIEPLLELSMPAGASA